MAIKTEDRNPACSIVLPTLNEEKYLGRTLESLKKQSFSNYELIIADSASIDKTLEIAKSYDAQVISCPRGKLTARDIGIRAAKGAVIIAADADCEYPESWLGNTMAEFKDNTVVAVTGPRLYEGHSYIQELQLIFYWQCWRLFGSNSAFRNDAYFMSGGFNLSINQFDSQLMVNEEEVLFRDRLAAFGRIVYQEWNPVKTSTRRYSMKDMQFSEAIRNGERF